MTLDEFIQKLEAQAESTRRHAIEWFRKAQVNPTYWTTERELNARANALMDVLIMAKTITTEQPAPICQNCGTPAQVGWHEVRTAVDDVQCHVDDDSHQEIEY